MSTAIAREREMKWMQSIGIKGIKVDFFGGDKQETMRLYEDILSDANRYGLQVVFHGCTIPRGWERMYPNYVASEAVLASENVFFNEGAAIKQPFDLTLHPFCRNATASMDWGGIIMNKYLSKDNKSRHSRKTTDIFEMASGIIMQTATNGQWYIAGLNALKEPLTLSLDVKAFGPLSQLYLDNKQGEPTLTTLKPDKKGFVKITLQPNGGLIIK